MKPDKKSFKFWRWFQAIRNIFYEVNCFLAPQVVWFIPYEYLSEFFGRVGIQFEDLILNCKYRKRFQQNRWPGMSGLGYPDSGPFLIPWFKSLGTRTLVRKFLVVIIASFIQEEVNVKNPISFQFLRSMDNAILSINHVTFRAWRRHSKDTVNHRIFLTTDDILPLVILTTWIFLTD